MPRAEITTEYGRSTRKKALLIVNPSAGNLRATEAIAPVVEALSNRGYEPLCFTTTCRSDATRIANEYGADRELLIVVGGDGTMNEVVRGVMTLEEGKRPAIGYIPMGSTNDFALALGLPKRLDLQIGAALDGVPTPIDVGRFNGRHYAYLASFGAFTDVSYSTSQQAKNVFGFLAYLGTSFSSIANIKPTHISAQIDGETVEGDYAFVSVSNTKSMLGLINLSKRGVELNDGLFEVMMIKCPRNPIEFGRIAVALSSGDLGCEFIHFYSCSEVKFLLEEPVNWMLDGELVEAGREVRVQNVRSGVRIMLPKADGSPKPSQGPDTAGRD